MTSDTPREFSWNVAFDLDLRGGDRPRRDARLEQVADELALFPWMATVPGDTLRARRPFPDEFVEYLTCMGLHVPRVVLEPEVTRASRLEPFGWDEAMAALNLRYAGPAAHPSQDVVRRVNGRSFAASLEATLGHGLPGGVVRPEVTDITSLLRDLPWPPGGWVLKSEHGHAGMGMFRIPDPVDLAGAARGADAERARDARGAPARSARHGRASDGETARSVRGQSDRPRAVPDDRAHQAGGASPDRSRALLAFLDEARRTGDPLLLEPWLERTLDLTLSLQVGRSGTAHDIELHESEVSRQGSFIGFWLDPEAAWRATWGRELASLAPAIARALTQEGYHGPAAIDAFVARGEPLASPTANLVVDSQPPGPRGERPASPTARTFASVAHPPFTSTPALVPGESASTSPSSPPSAGVSREWLRPLSDINARHSMTGPVRDFCHRHLPDRVVHWRFFSRRRLGLPSTTAGLRTLLGETHYDPPTRTGILLTNPLHFRKIGLLFSAPDRAGVEELLQRFRESVDSAP